MAKPRIIIADSDINYIIPLQMKFAEDMFEKADIELITDREYFQKLFSNPQHADILIISEEFYEQSLKRHSISHVFLMTEQYEEEKTENLEVNCIFKYTSLKEIFNEIMGKSAGVLNFTAKKKQSAQIVLVCSASGGTGKTTVAMGLSASLTKNYKRVLYINASRLHSFQFMLENTVPINSTEVYAKLTVAGENVYSEIKHTIRKELFHYLPPFKTALMSMGLKYAMYEKIAIAAKKSGDYDFIVVDSDVAFDEDMASLISIADKVVVVTSQTMAAVAATNVWVSNVNGVHEDKYVFLCNDFCKEKDNALISPSIKLKFNVSDYVEHFSSVVAQKPELLSKESSIQRAAFLII